MSNNAAVTVDGGEIGRAQEVQAFACGVEPTVLMNPILLKPETDTGSQLVVQGKYFGTMPTSEFGTMKSELMPKIVQSFEEQRKDCELVIVEGAGSVAGNKFKVKRSCKYGICRGSTPSSVVSRGY